MGTCSSSLPNRLPLTKQNIDSTLPEPLIKQPSYSAISQNSNEADSNDYRVDVVAAYTHQIQKVLRKKYKKNAYYSHSFSTMIIPKVINKIIERYYDKYQIYGVTLKQYKISHLPELESIVYDTGNIWSSNNRIYIKDFNKEIHSFINTINNEHESIFYETYPFTDFLHLKEIQFLQHSRFNSDRKLIKLNNGLIFEQRDKKQNGYSKLTYFKRKKINIIQMDCGSDHSLFLTEKGLVYSMGRNDEGQCGIVKTKGGVRVNDSYIPTPTLIQKFVEKNCNITSISCGDSHNCCIDASKEIQSIWLFGRNKSWQCNGGTKRWVYLPGKHQMFRDINIVKAKCGIDFTVILSDKGFMYSLGNLSTPNSKNYLRDVKYINLIDKSIKDFDVSSNYVVWITNSNNIYSLESKALWYGWSKTKRFFNKNGQQNQSKLNSNTPIFWDKDMFPMCPPSKIHNVIVGKHHFIIIAN